MRTRPSRYHWHTLAHSTSNSMHVFNVLCYTHRYLANAEYGYVIWLYRLLPWLDRYFVLQIWTPRYLTWRRKVSVIPSIALCRWTLTASIASIAISYRTSQQMSHIRDDLTEKCSALLLGYRRNCAASTAPSQVNSPRRCHVFWLNHIIANNPGSVQSFGGVHISHHKVQATERFGPLVLPTNLYSCCWQDVMFLRMFVTTMLTNYYLWALAASCNTSTHRY